MTIVNFPTHKPKYQFVRTTHQEANDTHWCFMHTNLDDTDNMQRPCFHPGLLKELFEYKLELNAAVRNASSPLASTQKHFVLASDAPVFNLGGDLSFFAQLIRAQDRTSLLSYAHQATLGVHSLHQGLDMGMHTIALVQGDALGGGFEAALSCHTIVAEKSVNMGLPEVLFDLFPGMGAYSFLSRRIGPVQAERIILSGKVYSSDELFEMGLIDVLVNKGEGVSAVEDVIRRNRRIPNARRAMSRVRDAYNPVTLDELMNVTEIWVNTALSLGQKSLSTMERLVNAQQKRYTHHVVNNNVTTQSSINQGHGM